MALPAWLGAGLISGASALLTNAASARAARRQMEFQERMSSTAHQREVKDLRAAGINPMIRSLGGASTPGGAMPSLESPGAGAVSSALSARMNEAQLKLVEAQAGREEANAALARTQAADISSSAEGRYALTAAQVESTQLTAAQARELLPFVKLRAEQEIGLMASSAQAARARAVLDELAKEGAVNLAEFEKRIGEAGPWVRALFNLIKVMKR